MKQSNTKKRRLVALNLYQGTLGSSAGQHAVTKQQQQPQPTQGPPPALLPQQPAQATATISVGTAAPSAAEAGAFPYNPLISTQTAHAAGKLLIPASSSCTGNVEDCLEQLMTPNMPQHIARNMIATRTVDKSVVLDNPTAKLNITKPSNASRGRRQQLASKLLPLAKRRELSQLPASGLDFGALTALHDLWGKYVCDLLVGKPDIERLLQTADWHGAILTVADSKHKIYIGRSGIVAKATANTFVLVSTDGRSSIVPLKGSVFECIVPGVNLPVSLTGSSQTKLQCIIKASNTGS
eukprot:GHUV01012761.1.p1 GENE.GHUV01012761.1~~GHUV01012761.1.p1  ORF type:complete len:330 (+),score=97.52 GHUV01012761.1:104-991(+)